VVPPLRDPVLRDPVLRELVLADPVLPEAVPAEPVLRDPVRRDPVPRDPVPRDPVPPDEVLRVPVLFDVFAPVAPADLLVPVERLAPDAEDFARDEAVFRVPLADRELLLVERDVPLAELLREPVERVLVERLVDEPVPDEEDRDEPDRAELPRDEEVPLLALPPDASAGLHLPDITRCAASATASAMIEPSLVALATTLLAACEAVSAASRPASRIFFRAAGLALIAAAAAASPAASISLLNAAFASLSTVLSPDPEPDDDELERELDEFEREELLRADLAIAYLPPSGERHFKAVPVP
jgi:hypothetical protein